MPITASDPNPDEDDLSEVLQNVALDKLAVNRPRIANHPDTGAFLETGLQLLRDDFISFEGSELDGLERCRLFESLSRARLLDRAAEDDNARDRPLVLTTAKYRERWRHKNRYTADLLAYLFRPAPQRAYMRHVDAMVDQLIATEPLGRLVRVLADAELKMVLGDLLFPLHAIVEVALPNDPRVRAYLRAQEQVLLPAWANVYERIANAYGLRLSIQYTFLDVAKMLNALINGVLTSARSCGGQVPTLANGDNVLVGAIFAMLPTLFANPVDDLDALYSVSHSRPPR